MSPTSSAASGEVSIQEQVAACIEELQILGTLEKVIAASEVSSVLQLRFTRFYCTQPSTY